MLRLRSDLGRAAPLRSRSDVKAFEGGVRAAPPSGEGKNAGVSDLDSEEADRGRSCMASSARLSRWTWSRTRVLVLAAWTQVRLYERGASRHGLRDPMLAVIASR